MPAQTPEAFDLLLLLALHAALNVLEFLLHKITEEICENEEKSYGCFKYSKVRTPDYSFSSGAKPIFSFLVPLPLK
jgi:hypothetical protein